MEEVPEIYIQHLFEFGLKLYIVNMKVVVHSEKMTGKDLKQFRSSFKLFFFLVLPFSLNKRIDDMQLYI